MKMKMDGWIEVEFENVDAGGRKRREIDGIQGLTVLGMASCWLVSVAFGRYVSPTSQSDTAMAH